MVDDKGFAKLQQELHRVLSETINEYEGSSCYLNRFVVLTEIVDAKGQRALISVAAEDMMSWDTLGLLDYARSTEQAAILRDGMET